jgi:hypothetical protein
MASIAIFRPYVVEVSNNTAVSASTTYWISFEDLCNNYVIPINAKGNAYINASYDATQVP